LYPRAIYDPYYYGQVTIQILSFRADVYTLRVNYIYVYYTIHVSMCADIIFQRDIQYNIKYAYIMISMILIHYILYSANITVVWLQYRYTHKYVYCIGICTIDALCMPRTYTHTQIEYNKMYTYIMYLGRVENVKMWKCKSASIVSSESKTDDFIISFYLQSLYKMAFNRKNRSNEFCDYRSNLK